MGVLAFLIVVLAIPLTVNIAQKQQELRQHAGFSGSCTTVGSQQQVPCSKTCSDGSTVQGVSVQECQSILQWYDDGTCYASCPTATPPPPTAPPSTTTPTQTTNNLKPVCPGECTGVQTCEQVNGGKVDTNYRCDSGACCITGSGNSSPNIPVCGTGSTAGATCVAHDKCGVDIAGTLVNGSCTGGQECCLISGGTGGTCSSTPSSDWQYTCGCTSPEDNVPGGGHTALCTKNPQQSDGNYCWSNALHPGYTCTPPTAGTPTTPAGTTQPHPTGIKCPSGTTPDCQGAQLVFLQDGTYICNNQAVPVCPPSTSTGATTPTCDGFINPPACQPLANSCNTTTGTRTGTADKLQSTGSTSCTKAPRTEQCTLSSPATCATPNICNSSNQCVTQGQTAPSSGNTQISFVIGLDGIGTTPDRKNPNDSSGSNKNPRTTSKSFVIEIFDSNNNFVKAVGSGLLTATTQPRLSYNSGSGKYEGSVSVDLNPGTYSVKIQGDRYLKRRLGTITAGQSNSLSGSLVAGAMAGNNFLSAADYGNLVGCLFKPLQSGITFCNLADLDDDGVVDQFDYNLFLREISQVQNGD